MIPTTCKRLIEVDFPIAKVSEHSAKEKSIRHGHPSTLHLWWARRPLAACRAVLVHLYHEGKIGKPKLFYSTCHPFRYEVQAHETNDKYLLDYFNSTLSDPVNQCRGLDDRENIDSKPT